MSEDFRTRKDRIQERADELIKGRKVTLRTWKGYNANGCSIIEDMELELNIRVNTSSSDVSYFQFKVYAGTSHCLLGFDVRKYPACCAMYQLNNFMVNAEWCPHELAHELIDMCIDSFRAAGGNGITQFQRVVINFVERFSSNSLNPEDDISDRTTVEDQIYYQGFYKWAKAQKAYREMKFYNQNSGNIIHLAEVVLHH